MHDVQQNCTDVVGVKWEYELGFDNYLLSPMFRPRSSSALLISTNDA